MMENIASVVELLASSELSVGGISAAATKRNEGGGPQQPTNKKKKKARLRALRDQVVKVVKTAVVNAASEAVSALPFGHVVVALCEDAAGRYTVLKENKEAVQLLVEWTDKIGQRTTGLLVFFEKKNDSEGVELAQQLLEATFCSFRIASDAQRKPGVLSAVAYYLGCHSTADALSEASLHLKDTALDAFMRSSDYNMTESTAAAGAKESKAAITTTTVAPALRKCPAPDAVEFWTTNEFGNEVSVLLLLDALYLFCDMQEDGILADHPALSDNPMDNEKLRLYFAGTSAGEVTTASRFARFVGKAASVAEALMPYLPDDACAATASPLPVPSDPLLSLEAALDPVHCGQDLAKHLALYAEGTREWVFHDVEAWAALSTDDPTHRVFWVKGTGGLGKSIIAAQLVQRYGVVGTAAAGEASPGPPQPPSSSSSSRPLHVAAYFFCKHDDSVRNDPRRVVATLAFRLASQLPAFREELTRRLQDADTGPQLRDVLSGESGGVEDVYEHALAAPLEAALKATPEGEDIFLVVDALDELHEGASRQQLLRLVGRTLPKLPSRVRFVVTSRPEEDIVRQFASLQPYTIQKQEEKQLGDLRLYARKAVIEATSLSKLGASDADQVVDAVVDRADGVFLALWLISHTLKTQDQAAGSADLTPADVQQLLDSRANLVDGTYTDTLTRIQQRLVDVAKGDTDVLAELKTALQQIIAALLAARQPLLKQDVHELCGGAHARGEGLTQELLSALSLLFSASGPRGSVEPLHKTVVDYLRDKSRSGEHFVDERQGHAALALASLRLLKARELLPSAASTSAHPTRLVAPAEAQGDSALMYALRHGHMHLAACAEALSGQRSTPPATGSASPSPSASPVPAAVQTAQDAWQDAFLAERPAPAPAFAPTQYKISTHQLTAAFGQWLLLASHSADRKQQLVAELVSLKHVYDHHHQQLQGQAAGLRRMWHEVALMYGSRWAPQADVADCVLAMVTDCSRSGLLFGSPAQEALCSAVGIAPEVLRIPLRVGLGACLNTIKCPSPVKCVDVSPDGRHAAAGTHKKHDHTLWVWRTDTGELMQTFQGDTDVQSVQWSPDGQRLLAGNEDATVQVWDVASGEVVNTLRGHTEPVLSAGWSPDGQRIVSGSEDWTVRVWDATTGQLMQTLEDRCELVRSVAWSPDGQRIVSASDDCNVRVWDVTTGEVAKTLRGHGLTVWCVAWSPDGRQIASCSQDELVIVWDVATGKIVKKLEGHHDMGVRSVAWDFDGQHVVSGGTDSRVFVWDVAAGKPVQRLEGHDSLVLFVAMARTSSGQQIVVSGSVDNTVRVWDTAATKEDTAQVLSAGDGGKAGVAWSPDGRRLAVGGANQQIYDASTGEHVQFSCEQDGFVRSVAWSPDGRHVLVAGTHSRVWDPVSGEMDLTMLGKANTLDEVTSVAWSPDGQRAVFGCEDNAVRVLDMPSATGEPTLTLEGHSQPVTCVAWSPDGLFIASSSSDEKLLVWDAATGERVKALVEPGHGDSISSVAWSPSGRHIVCGRGVTVQVLDASTGATVHTLSGHSEAVCCVAWGGPQGRYIVSGSKDQTARVWDAESGAVLQTLKVLQKRDKYVDGLLDSTITSAAWSPDGQRVALVGKDCCTLRVHDLTAALVPPDGNGPSSTSGSGSGKRDSGDDAVANEPTEQQAKCCSLM